MSLTISAADLQSALKIIDTIDAKSALTAFEGQDAQSKIQNGLILAEDALQIIGVFDPPVAIIANDLQVGVAIEKVVGPLIVLLITWLMKQPSAQKARAEINASPLNPLNSIPKAIDDIGAEIGGIVGQFPKGL